MKISLVTPVKDEAGTLAELIDGVAAQTRRPDEWVVVDGGSRDETVAVLERSGRCRVMSEPGNIAIGRNRGIAAASGEIIATIDAGCRPEPDWLETLVGPLETGAARVTAGATRARVETPFDAAQAALLDQFVLAVPRVRSPAMSARCLAFRREVWERRPFPEWLDHGEDAWLLGQWKSAGMPVTRVPESVVHWRLRSSTGSFLRQHFRYMRGDGRAGLNTVRHILRGGFYAILVGAALLSGLLPGAGALAAAGWLLYAALSALRLPGVSVGRPLGFRLPALLILVVLLPLMDGVKMAGYLAGLLDRLAGKGRPE